MKHKWIIAVGAVLALLPSMAMGALATGEMPETESYIYSEKGEVIAAPVAYEAAHVVVPEELGIEKVTSLQDIAVDNEGNLYLIDSTSGRLIVLDSTYHPKRILTEFTYNGAAQALSGPMGVSFGRDGRLYVADTGNGRVVVFNTELECLNIIDAPDRDTALYDYEYKPLKVDADSSGRVYVIAENQTQGIFQFGANGEFLGYLGATKVVPDWTEIFFRMFASREQLKGMLKSVPTEYNNLCINEDNFVYCTISALNVWDIRASIESNSNSVTPIRLLNQNGSDILQRMSSAPQVGDLQFYTDGRNYGGASAFIDAAASQYGIYSVLDRQRGRIFTYDERGELMYIFGGRGSQKGQFISPTALAYSGENILVADSHDGTVQVFSPTAYAKRLTEGLAFYHLGEYEQEQQVWEELLEVYGGNPLICSGIGRTLYNQQNYREAMTYFRQANNRTYYSKALQKYISNIGMYILAAVVGFLLVAVSARLLHKKFGKKRKPSLLLQRIGYAKYIAFHPFEGFWDMVHEARGDLKAATVLLILAVVVNILRIRFAPYLFNYEDFTETNVLLTGAGGVLLPLLLWCVANWCLTSLMDGKGTFKQIYMFSCYSLWPMIVLFPLITGISYLLSVDSASFLNIAMAVTVIWMGFLFFSGTLSIHQYSAGKTVLTIALSIIGMMILVFIGVLIVTLCQQMVVFVELLIREQYLRM